MSNCIVNFVLDSKGVNVSANDLFAVAVVVKVLLLNGGDDDNEDDDEGEDSETESERFFS